VSRLLKLAGVLAGAVIALLLCAPQAFAHAVVVSSDPADGSRLPKAPAAVTIRFDESVGLKLGYLQVVDSAGRPVAAGAVSHPGGDGAAITVPLKAGLGDGSYLASFRVVSADSHPIAGSIRFVVGNGPLNINSGPSGTAKVDRGVQAGLAVSHSLSFAGVALVGGSWLIFSIWPSGQRRRGVRRAIWSGWTLAAVGAVGEFVLQGPYAAGSSLSSLTHRDLLDATLHVNAGQLLSLRMVLIGVLGVGITALLGDDDRRRPTWGPEAAAIVGVGIVVTFAAAGHSQSANPRWLAVLIAALHLTAMIVWLGGLVVLLIAATSRAAAADEQDELAAGLPIFSRVALVSVATLAVTGTILAWREVGTVDAIATTWYGRLVLVKVGLFVAIVLLGYLARRVLNRPVEGGGTLARLRRVLLTEVVVGAAVLAATGVLIAQSPGKVALAEERSKPRQVIVSVTTKAQARVEVNPGSHGVVEVSVELIGDITPNTLTAAASLPSRQLGPIPVSLQSTGAKTYTASGVNLPVAGTWELTLTVQTSEFDATTSVVRLRIS
jgi:copper transport protein